MLGYWHVGGRQAVGSLHVFEHPLIQLARQRRMDVKIFKAAESNLGHTVMCDRYVPVETIRWECCRVVVEDRDGQPEPASIRDTG